MSLERIIVGLVSIILSLVGLGGETGSKVLSLLLILVFLALFLPPVVKQRGAKGDVARSMLMALQFASVAWVSVIGSGWLIATWVKTDGSQLTSTTAHQLVVDHGNGIRSVPGLRPFDSVDSKTLHGSYVVHASPSNGSWLVPVGPVVDDAVTVSLRAFEVALGIAGVLLLFVAAILQGLLHSGTIIGDKK